MEGLIFGILRYFVYAYEEEIWSFAAKQSHGPKSPYRRTRDEVGQRKQRARIT